MLLLTVLVFVIICGSLIGYFKFKGVSKKINQTKDLIATGIQITVDLEDCEVKHSSYLDTNINTSFTYGSIFQATQDSSKLQEMSIIVYTHKGLRGESKIYQSNIIKLPIETVRFFMMKTKSTKIYINPSNHNDYLFDTSFINK